jgi:hypothetical protein
LVTANRVTFTAVAGHRSATEIEDPRTAINVEIKGPVSATPNN